MWSTSISPQAPCSNVSIDHEEQLQSDFNFRK
jgi:hypothetical protein